MRRCLTIDTPTGPFTLTEADGAIVAAGWGGTGADHTPLLADAAAQLAEYWAGSRTVFELPLRIDVSDFQHAVCDEMQSIPYGETRTYGEIARRLGVTPQAVGQACGANPIAILIPCHRVLGADGRLTGFSGRGGVETKVALLRHEGAGGFLL